MIITKGRVAAVAATAFTVVSLSMVSASAADQPQGSSATAPANSVTGASVVDGSLYQKDINAAVVDVLRTPKAGSVWQNTLNAGIVTEEKLSTAVKAKLNKPAEVYGKTGGTFVVPSTTIGKIGGPWLANKTHVGSFTLPAGTWLLNSSAMFDRKNAGSAGYQTPTTDTYPQFAVRYGATEDNQFGSDAGTIMGVPVSRAGRVELTGSSIRTITTTQEVTFHVYGFGYNEDTSAFGSANYPNAGDEAQFTVAGQVTAVRIG